jgi:4-methylaminobutanoate oxidase (formaldehyde-forming)
VNNPEGVSSEFIKSGRFQIGVAGERCAATAYLSAPYDPKRTRILV